MNKYFQIKLNDKELDVMLIKLKISNRNNSEKHSEDNRDINIKQLNH